VIDTSSYDGNGGTCTFSSAQTNTWHSKDVSAAISCNVTDGSGTRQVLGIGLYGVG
jgi:hypothetical protein